MDVTTSSPELTNKTWTQSENEGRLHYFGGYSTEMTLFDKVVNVLDSMISPALSVIGLVGNVLTMMVLRRHGLNTSSNILLFCLAIADIVYLCGKFDFPSLVYDNGSYIGWPGPHRLAYTLYVFYQIHYVCYYAGHFCSMTFPVLLTTERLIALFLPLRFKTIVTPTRTCLALGLFAFLSLLFGVGLASMNITLDYTFYPPYNRTVGLKSFSRLARTTTIENKYMMAFQILEGIIPLVYVCIGCVVIQVKISLLSTRRSELTASESKQDTRKTSIMLCTICIFYIVCGGFYSILEYLPRDWEKVDYVSRLQEIFLVVNSSFNFVVYVVLNKSFRQTYISLITCGQGLSTKM